MEEQLDLIIDRCKQRDAKAQLYLYDKYCQGMYTIACRYLKQEEAKDAMQEGFIKAFANLEYYKYEYAFGAWLKRIIINQCIDELKKKKQYFSEIDVYTLEVFEDEDNWSFNNSISKQSILNAIETLQEKQKVVVKLYLIEGYDHSEISDILSIPIKTSRTYLHRGKLELRKQLKAIYDEARY